MLSTYGYGYKTYSAAVELMADWAKQLSTAERQVGFDEIRGFPDDAGSVCSGRD